MCGYTTTSRNGSDQQPARAGLAQFLARLTSIAKSCFAGGRTGTLLSHLYFGAMREISSPALRAAPKIERDTTQIVGRACKCESAGSSSAALTSPTAAASVGLVNDVGLRLAGDDGVVDDNLRRHLPSTAGRTCVSSKHGFENRAQAARARLALHRTCWAIARSASSRSSSSTDFHLEELLILLRQRVLRFDENPHQRFLVELL